MKKTDIIKYIRRKYVNEAGFPVSKEAEVILTECYEARDYILTASRDWDRRKEIAQEVAYARNTLALFRVLSADPGAWDALLAELRVNKVPARDIQAISSSINGAYKELLADEEQAYLEDTSVTVIRGIKSYCVENGRDGITMRIKLMHPEPGTESQVLGS